MAPPKHQLHSANQELAAAIRGLARIHLKTTGKAPSAATIIELLRERGQKAQADELERTVEGIRARRRRD